MRFTKNKTYGSDAIRDFIGLMVSNLCRQFPQTKVKQSESHSFIEIDSSTP